MSVSWLAIKRIFASKKVKITKNILYKKVSIAGILIAVTPILWFL